MASSYIFEIDGYVFPRPDVPALGPIVEMSPQRWLRQPILGEAAPATILSFLGFESQRWNYVSRASTATKDKLLAIFGAKREVLFKTPQNTTGFNVLMTDLRINHLEPLEQSRFLCEFTIVSRGAIVEEEGVTIVRKSADETVNNSAVLQDDDELFFSVGAGETWVGTIVLFVNIKAASDIRVQVAGPSGSTGNIVMYGGQEDVADLHRLSATSINSGSLPMVSSISNTLVAAAISFIVKNGATAGQVILRWAQNVAQVEDTKVLANSYIVAHKQ